MSDTGERDLLREQAEQRMLEAAIEEVVADESVGQDRSAILGAAIPRSLGPSRLLAAALVLLGCAVVVSTVLLVPQRGPDEAGQGPALPRAVRVTGGDELARVDVTTENLDAYIASPRDLDSLGRLAKLRAVSISLIEKAERDSDRMAWRKAGPDAFEALAQCPRLERVRISSMHPDVDHRAYGVLQRLPALREIALSEVVVDGRLVAGWSKLALRSLHLVAARMDPEGFVGLCQLPLLQELRLVHALHLEGCDLTALGRLRQLRRLELRGVGSPLSDALTRRDPQALGFEGRARSLLTPEVVTAIASLPELEALSLRSSVAGDEMLARLPAGLRELHLGSAIGLTPAGVRGLARLRRLAEVSWTGATEAPPDGEEPDAEGVGRAWLELLSSRELAALKRVDVQMPTEELEAELREVARRRDLELVVR